MALAQIIDLDEVRRARRSPSVSMTAPAMDSTRPVWCYYWMPVYYWYLA